jgi:NRPS condensation-like uncharacterized protein
MYGLIGYFLALLKIILLYMLYADYGLFVTLIFPFVYYNLRYYLIKTIFGLEEVSGMDEKFFSFQRHQRVNLLVVVLIEEYDAERLRKLLIDRAINKVPKLTMQLLRKFNTLYWKRVPLTDGYKRIKIIEEPFNSEQGFVSYASSEVNCFIDVLNDLPYSIELCCYDEKAKRGGIIFKFDHILSDGLGLTTLITSIADNYNANIFPSVLRPYKFNISDFLIDKYYDLLSIIYIPYVFYLILSIMGQNTPLKQKQGNYGLDRIRISKAYNLNDFNHIRKTRLKISFNDLVVSAISNGLNQLCTDKGYKDICEFISVIPVGVTYLPTNSSEVDLTNKVTGFVTRIPAVSNILNDTSKVSQSLKRQLNNLPLVKALFKLGNYTGEILPFEFYVAINNLFMSRIDFICSNIPGPTEPLYYDGCKLTDIIGLPSAGGMKIFIPIVSYNKRFRITVAVNECVDFDQDKFLKYFDEGLNKLIEHYNE